MGKKKHKKRDAAVSAPRTPPDAVDAAIAAWRREFPALDVTSAGVVARVTQLAARFTQALEMASAQHGLTKASFEALAVLRRSGRPCRLSQNRLMQELCLTPGTVSARISRLAGEGLVERLPDPDDRRGVIVALTDKGESAFESIVDQHLATERRLLAALDAGEQELLAGLLRRLLQDVQPAARGVE